VWPSVVAVPPVVRIVVQGSSSVTSSEGIAAQPQLNRAYHPNDAGADPT
jgi:hypothetical protein